MNSSVRNYKCIQQGKLSSGDTCYACGAPATSIEHAPPRSWFANNAWCDPETVPACSIHNEKNSPDVEFMAGMLTAMAVNPCANAVWDRVKRGIARTPNSAVGRLLGRVQSDGTIKLDPQDVMMLRRAMRAIGNALHFITTGIQQDHDWFVLSSHPSFILESPEIQSRKTRIEANFSMGKWQSYIWQAPDCFRWWKGNVDNCVVYRLEFYDFLQFYLVERRTSSPDTKPILDPATVTESA